VADPAPGAAVGEQGTASRAPTGRSWLARIDVTLKAVVNDPQGLAVMGGLHQLGYASVENVRIGKYLEVRLNAPDRAAAAAQIDEMCRRLLANPVIEDYRYVLDEAAGPAAGA
jgi:phosphoribosylformylglycinamidine synthase subunit PurS